MAKDIKQVDNRTRSSWLNWIIAGVLIAGLLTACGDEPLPTPNLAEVATPVDNARPTVTPPFQAATNITPTPTANPAAVQPTSARLSPTASVPLSTPIIQPTPTTPIEGEITSDDLGISAWADTNVLWSPRGDIFMLQVMREGTDGDFYYLVRPPESVQSSFRLPRGVYGTLAWSPDGRYLSYIERDSDGASGPVKLIDTQRDITRERKLFSGPCTGASWLATGKLVAACGTSVYLLPTDDAAENGAKADNPETLFKLENGRFPGSNIDLSLLVNVLPSPDGTALAMFGLRKQKGVLPLGEIAFYNLANKKLEVLERNNRPVTLVDWTPDSKYVILRNLTGDWAVPYTFDYYLADPAKLKITINLTKSNDKCDPVLGSKPECQGTIPSTIQSSGVVFAPDGDRYFFTGLRYVARPGAALATAERLSSNRLSASKEEKLTETAAGERIIGLTWLPNGHYFYSVGLGNTSAKAFLDGKALEVGGGSRTNRVVPKSSPVPTKSGAGAVSGFSLNQAQAVTPIPETPGSSPVSTTPAAPSATALPPTVTTTPIPRGTSLLGFETVTAQARTPNVPPPTRTTDPNITPTANASTQFPRPVAYYMSPTGNWVLSVERVAAPDKIVQFQARLIPYILR